MTRLNCLVVGGKMTAATTTGIKEEDVLVSGSKEKVCWGYYRPVLVY